MPHPPHNLCPASSRDRWVWGAQRPGYPLDVVSDALLGQWCDDLVAAGVRRVVCLLEHRRLQDLYGGRLLRAYGAAFEHVVHQPWPDFCVPNIEQATTLLSTLDDAARAETPIVVHCSAGYGRTGKAMALWLVHRYGLAPDAAADEVVAHARALGASRNPGEGDVADELGRVLAQIRAARAVSSGAGPASNGHGTA